MSTTVTFNAIQYIVPSYNDTGYAQGTGNLSTYLVALSTGTLQQSGGLFQLTADADFGPNFGLKALYLKSETANPATAGVLRLAKTDTIGFRNNANGANLALGINGSDQLTFNSVVLLTPGVTVAQGGTGVTSMTAYAVLCGGTTSTGAVQSVAAVGSSGQVLTSNGAGALPTFQNVAGTGTVNSGTQYQIGYYATSTNAISGNSGITTDANGALCVGSASDAVAGHNFQVVKSVNGLQRALFYNTNATSSQERRGFVDVEGSNGAYTLGLFAGQDSSNVAYEMLTGGTNIQFGIAGVSKASMSATQFLFMDGAVGSPGITFVSDPDSGLYHIGANDIALGTNGTKALEINATQQVDIANTKQTVGGNQVFPIVQIINGATTTAATTTSASFQDTSLTATITPKFNTSKIIIMVSCGNFNAPSAMTNDAAATLLRGVTNLGDSSAGFVDFTAGKQGAVSFQYYDSPATTSSTTYKIQIKSDGTRTVTWGIAGQPQSLILMEIAQ